MARFGSTKDPKPIEIDKFKGLNESVGETEIELGEAVYMRNFRITNNYKAKKREGHQTFVDFDNSEEAYIIWHGLLAGNNRMLIQNNGNVYDYDLDQETTTTAIADLITEGVVTLIGTITNAETRGFYFNDNAVAKIYMINGTDYKEYDGTTYQNVVPYVPTVAIGSPPAGGGTLFEQINLLTGEKSQEFIGDGSSTLYQLVEDTIDSDTVLCTIDGVTKTENTDFTVNRTLGQVTFTVAPASEALVILTWVKVVSGNADLVKKNKYFMDFGPGNDTTIFVWGNPDQKDRRMRSGTYKANYWPVNNFTLIGSGQYALTSITQQHNRQLIFTEGSAYYSYAEYNSTTEQFDYPVFDLNETVGMVAPGQGRIVDNKPITLFGQQIKEWVSTQIEDERNENNVSDKIKLSLSTLDLTTAVTFDYQKESEYWLNVDDVVYIWNYLNNTFYIFDNINGNSFIEYDKTVFYGAVGTVEKFNESIFADNDFGYEARMSLGFTDFGVGNLRKSSRRMWIEIEPDSDTSVCAVWQTDRKSLPETDCLLAEFRLFGYDDIKYDDWSYSTNYNPQPFRFKIRAKKYSVIRFVFINSNPEESLVLLSLLVEAETVGEVK